MDTVEIYRKSTMIAEKFKENVEKELNLLQQEIESLKQWQEFYKTSGLFGQATLFEQKEINLRRKKLLIEKGIPYPIITKEQLEVLTSIFNRCVPAEEFSFQSMPPEVVEAYLDAKEYKEVGVFDSIEIAYYDDDPIMFGKSICKSTGNELRRLIARWGDGLKPWEWFVSHYLNKKRSRIPSLRHHIAMLITPVILLTLYFLLPASDIFNAVKSLLLSLGVGFLAVSAWSLIVRFKAQKSYSSLLSEPIPSPFRV